MATTEDLRAALAEIERQEAGLGIGQPSAGAEDDDENAAKAARDEQAANRDAAINGALQAIVAEAMDTTIGRFQVAQQNPRALPEFMDLARAELLQLFRRGGDVVADVRRKQRIVATRKSTGDSDPQRPPDDDSGEEGLAVQLAATTQERDAFRNERDRLQAAENFLRTIGSEMVVDLTSRTQQVRALQGVVRRRDALLGEQRKAYLRELCHLRSIIKQWETKGYATTHDAGFFNWGDDDLVDRLGADAAQDAAEAVAEERAKLERELESERQRAAKAEDGLRRQVAVLEQQLRQAAVAAPPMTNDQATATEPLPEPVATMDSEAQTDEVYIADAPPTPGIQGDQDVTATVAPVPPDAAGCVACPVCVSRFRLTEIVPATAPERSRRPSKAASRRRSSARPPSGASMRAEAPPASSSSPATPRLPASTTDADVAALRAELEEQQRQQRALIARLQGKEDVLATAAKTKMDNDEARRRAEAQTIRKLHDEVRAKDALLEKKSRELTQLQDEAKRWFAQYQENLPPDHAPVNYAAMRRMSDAVTEAEAAEANYRMASWELVAQDLKAQRILRGLHDDCRQAEHAADSAQLRMCQRAYDAVSHQMRQRSARTRQQRLRLREEANRLWDVVLYYARSVHHAEEPLPPPPRYYSITGEGNAIATSLPPSPPGRKSELESVMMHHSAAAERAQAAKKQVLKLGPAAPEPASTRPSPRSRPGTAPARRPDAGSAYVDKLRVEVTGTSASREPCHSPSAYRSEHPPRPQTASNSNAFNPSQLAGKPLAARRAALVQLMRKDQDMLAVSKQRHIDGVYRDRAVRAQAPSFSSRRGAQPTDAELVATPGLRQQRLLGRNEVVQ